MFSKNIFKNEGKIKTFTDKLKTEGINCFDKEERLEETYFTISALNYKATVMKTG